MCLSVAPMDLTFLLEFLKLSKYFLKENKSVLSTLETSLGKPSLKTPPCPTSLFILIEVLKYRKGFTRENSISHPPRPQKSFKSKRSAIRQAPRDTFLSVELKTDLECVPPGEAGEIPFTEKT